MRKMLIVLGLVLLVSGTAMAQDNPKAEIFGGYTYLRLSGGVNCHGGGGSVAVNANKWIGFVGEVGVCRVSSLGFHAVSYQFGPKLTYRENDRVTPFAQVLFGGVHVAGGGVSQNGFEMTAGGGFDVKVARSFAIRLVDVGYVLTRVGGVRQNNVRIAAGIVIRLGSK